MKNQFKQNNAITLIALVITIIVLLILAGVTIVTLTGDNGLLQKAENAKEANEETTALEKVQVEVAGSYGLDGNIDINDLNKNLMNIKGLTYNEKSINTNESDTDNYNVIKTLPSVVKLNGYDIVISPTGKVEESKYIKDGLVLWYDGLNNTRNGNNSNASSWEDLSGNENDSTNSILFRSSWNEDCLVSSSDISIKTPWKFENSYTISIVFSPLRFYDYNTLWDNSLSDNDNECWISSNSLLNARSKSNYKCTSGITLNKKTYLTFSVNAENNTCTMYKDGVKICSTENSVYLNGGELIFNGLRNTSGTNKYYRIKVFNKALTDEESLINYRFDAGYDDTAITDSLAIYYDAINNTGMGHDSNITTWKDLSGNGNDAVISGIVYWENDGLYFWDTTQLVPINQNIVNTINSNVFTIQCILDDYNYSYSQCPTFLWSSNDDFSLYIYDINQNRFKLKISSNQRPEGNINDVINRLLTIRFDKNEKYCEILVNNNVISRVSINSNINVYDFNINRTNNKNTFKIKNLRIYDRILTDKEINMNYVSDKSRFNIQ